MNVAVDLGGTFLRSAADDGQTISDVRRQKIATVFDGWAPERVWEDIVDKITVYVDEVRARRGRVDRIIVGFPGPVADESVALCAPTIAGDSRSFPLASRLRELTHCDVVLLNDVSAAAWYLATRVPYSRFLVVTISSGIGSKMLVRAPDAAVLDDCSFAGEIGHIVVDASPDAPQCDCGGRGHLGAIASGRGYERAARASAMRDPASFQRSKAALRGVSPAELSNERDLVPALQRGDGWAWSVLRSTLDPLARVLAPVIHAAALRNVILIGGFATAIGDRYAHELDAAVKRYSAGAMFGVSVESFFELLALDEEACLRGAAIYGRLGAPVLQ